MPRKRITQAPVETPDALTADDAPRTDPETIEGLIALLPLTYPSRHWPTTAGHLTQRTATIAINAIREGNYQQTAAQLAGIAPITLLAWKRKGEEQADDPHSPYRIFLAALHHAEAEAEATLVRNVQRVGANDWKAHASVLGRRFRERWSEQRFGGESGAGGVTINVGIALTSSTSSPQVIEAQLLSVPRLEDE